MIAINVGLSSIFGPFLFGEHLCYYFVVTLFTHDVNVDFEPCDLLCFRTNKHFLIPRQHSMITSYYYKLTATFKVNHLSVAIS